MNKQLRHVSVAALILLAALDRRRRPTGRRGPWAASPHRQDNAIQLIARLTVDRGKILAADGTVLATNRVNRKHGLTVFTRHYPQNDLAPQVIGYATRCGHDDRARAVARRLPDRREHEPQQQRSSRRSTARRADREGRQRVAHAATRHPAARARTSSAAAAARSWCSTRRPAPSSRWPRRRPTTRTSWCSRTGLQQGQEDQGHVRRRVGAPEQRDRRPLSAGLDVQDGDRRGRARLGRLHAELAVLRPRLLHRVRPARLERGQPGPERAGGLRQRHARAGLRALDQLGLLQRRQADRRRGDPRVREEASASTRCRRSRRRPTSASPSGLYKYTSTAKLYDPTSASRSIRAGSRSASSTCSPRRCRWRWSAPRSRTAAVEPKPYLVQKIVAPDGSTRQQDDAAGPRPRDQAADRRRAEPDDAARRPGRDGTRRRSRPASRSPARRARPRLGLANVYDAWFVSFAPADNPRYVVAVVVEKQPNGFGASVSAPIAKADPRKTPAPAEHVSTL